LIPTLGGRDFYFTNLSGNVNLSFCQWREKLAFFRHLLTLFNKFAILLNEHKYPTIAGGKNEMDA